MIPKTELTNPDGKLSLPTAKAEIFLMRWFTRGWKITRQRGIRDGRKLGEAVNGKLYEMAIELSRENDRKAAAFYLRTRGHMDLANQLENGHHTNPDLRR